jgi:hypothetical protein
MPSNAIRHHSYDGARRELTIGFVGGGDYVYFGVPPQDYEALKGAWSKGNFVNEVIKPRYPFARRHVRAAQDAP